MAERRRWDDGTRIDGIETDFPPSFRNGQHYSNQTAHSLRSVINRFREGLDRMQEQLIRRKMRRIRQDGRR